jgi:hypothetical protein
MKYSGWALLERADMKENASVMEHGLMIIPAKLYAMDGKRIFKLIFRRSP